MKFRMPGAPTALCASAMLTLLMGCGSSRTTPGGAAVSRASIIVALTTVPDLAPEQWRGLSNIFLDSLTGATRDSVRMPSGWLSTTLDELIGNPELRSIRILRFITAGDTLPQVAIDTVGDLDFTRAPVLTFVRQGRVLVANIDLTLQSVRGSRRRVPFQILRSDDRYTYARIADFRTGTLHVGGRDYAVRVRNRSRGHPFYAVSTGTTFLVDLNGDGQFSETAALTVGGRPVAAEQVLTSAPFELGGRFYEIASIDSTGSVLRIRPSDRVIAVAENRRAPELRALLLKGGEFRLSGESGKVVLISFWATDCVYSERVRGAANDLVAKFGAEYKWVAIAKDTSRVAIEQYLRTSPIRGTVAMADSSVWATYNPAGATPVFIIVDRRGMVRFRAEGASAIAAISAKLDEVVASSR